MESPTYLLSVRYIAGAVAAYFGSFIFYRLFLHLLAKFPGPKLAAITRYYEAYFDVIFNGRYTFEIVELHKKYGPIVRISPHELHVNEPAYFDKLYRQEGALNKYAWDYNAFLSYGASVATPDRDTHKARRLPLGTFLSKANVTRRQVLIQKKVDKLCDRIATFANAKQTINLGAAVSAFTRDVVTGFIFGKDYSSLDHENFNYEMTVVLQGMGRIWQITKHIPWFGRVMRTIPADWVMKMGDKKTGDFLHWLEEIARDTKDLLTAATSSNSNEDASPKTIVHEIVNSGLPPSEKEFSRVFDEVSSLTGAGFETTSNVLRLVLYHVYSKPEILERLRGELASVTCQSSETVELSLLEQLPYFTSLLMEGLRMSPGIATRMARIAPDRKLAYGEWRIPASTPIGMTTLWMHLDETIYPEFMRFNPDRWMDLEGRKKADKTYAPFSKGTRICLGMHLAWAEMYLVLPAFVQRFNFRFEGASAEDFECERDLFIPGTKGMQF